MFEAALAMISVAAGVQSGTMGMLILQVCGHSEILDDLHPYARKPAILRMKQAAR